MSLFPFPLLWRVKFLTKKKIKNKLSFQSLRREKLDKILTLNRRKHQVTESPKRRGRRETFAAIYKRGEWGVNRESSTLFLPLVPHFPTLARHSWLRIARVISLCACVRACAAWLDLETAGNRSKGKLIAGCVISRSNLCWTMDGVRCESQWINYIIRDRSLSILSKYSGSGMASGRFELRFKSPAAAAHCVQRSSSCLEKKRKTRENPFLADFPKL